MKKYLWLGIVGLLGLAACPAMESGKTAAIVNGQKITVEEVDQSGGGRIAQQLYEMRKETLQDIIDQKILDQAARDKKTTVEILLKEEVESKVTAPTETEVKAVYDANKDRFDEPFETVRAQITNALKQNRQIGQRNQYVAELREKAKIEMKLAKPPVQKVEVSADDDPSIGPDKAKVTVIEFTDYQCPFCGRARATVNKMIETYPNDLRYVLRDFPLSFHRDAFAAHVAAQCANEQGKYWDYNKILFNNQTALKPDQLKQYAVEAGLKTPEFNQCLDGNKYASEVQKDMEDGMKAGVNGTPAFFVNGVMLSGAQPFENFKEIIDEELKK